MPRDRTDTGMGLRKGPVIKHLRKMYPGLTWAYERVFPWMSMGVWVNSDGWYVTRILEDGRVFYRESYALCELPELGEKFLYESE